ncbi:hypothetical protein V1477_013902 [Vespula maculifrons]|uniref:Uncharacterized protein n=1 Tax=Vespula maculifrons TaxID=7453 RepID=A0ABD2BQ61_VESMC
MEKVYVRENHILCCCGGLATNGIGNFIFINESAMKQDNDLKHMAKIVKEWLLLLYYYVSHRLQTIPQSQYINHNRTFVFGENQ